MENKLENTKIPKKNLYGRSRPFPTEGKELAIKLLAEGNSLRATGRIVGVSHQTVTSWLKLYVEKLPQDALCEPAHTVEVDELCTFVKKK